jgi:hypothetical protein
MIAIWCSPYSGRPSIAHTSSQCWPVGQLMPTQPSAARTTPSIGADRRLAGRPRRRIRCAINIGYGSVDSNASTSETSTSRTRPRFSACNRNAVRAPSAP